VHLMNRWGPGEKFPIRFALAWPDANRAMVVRSPHKNLTVSGRPSSGHFFPPTKRAVPVWWPVRHGPAPVVHLRRKCVRLLRAARRENHTIILSCFSSPRSAAAIPP
jgi:hypothetical protein